MPSQQTLAKYKALQRRYSHLKHQAKQLSNARNQLIQKQVLLDALCDTFTVVSASLCAYGTDKSLLDSRFDELSQLEGSLLSELGQHSCSPTQLQDWQLLWDIGVDTIAPRRDPLAYFKLHLSLPPLQEASTVTAAEIAQSLRDIVLESSVQLHIMEMEGHEFKCAAEERIREMWQRHFQMLMSLILSGRAHVVEEISLFSLATLTVEMDTDSNHTAQIAGMPALMNLTEKQLQEISAGTSLFMRLLNGVLREQQQLQAELTCDTNMSAAPSSSSSDSLGGDSNGTGGSSSCLSSLPDGLHSLHRDLEGHQRSTTRLQVLLRKEYMLKAAAVGWFLGCVSWRQIVKACVVSWPYPLRATMLTQQIARYAQEIGGRSAPTP